MDLSTIIIGIVALALFVVPIMYIQRVQKRKAEKQLHEFITQGEAQQLKLTKHEFWDDCYGIGLDERQQKLFYVRKFKDREQQKVVSLADMKKCSVSNLSRESNGTKVIDQIELRFTPRDAKAQDVCLEFYSREVNLMLAEELQTANKWSAIANEGIVAASASVSSHTSVPTA